MPANPDAPRNGLSQAPTAPTAPTATTTKVSKYYQHWADGDGATGSAAEWNNNILSANKSDYFEGEVIPNVFYFPASNNTPLVNGQSYTFNITYNYYQAGTNAGGYAYMTTYNLDRQPPTGITGVAPTADPVASNSGGIQGQFFSVNANVTAVSNTRYTTSGGNTDAHVTVTFTYTGPTTSGGAEFYFGLMVAAPGMVTVPGQGPTDGANAWTGGSLQTTVDIGGSGATSIQLAPSAIIVGEINGLKYEDVNGDGTRDADGIDNIAGNADDEAGLSGWTIFLDTNNNGSLDAGERSTVTGTGGLYSFSVTPDADPLDPDNDPYIVREVMQAGWIRTSTNPGPITITSQSPVANGVNFGNQRDLPALTIEKSATVPGGTADQVGEVVSYTIAVRNTGNQPLTGVIVTDPFVSNLQLVPSAATADNELDLGETWNYTATHAVTQAEMDAGGLITNTATADSTQTAPVSDDASVPVEQKPAMTIAKDATVPGGTADVVGEVVSYTIEVRNTGNQTLTDVQVTDAFIDDLQLIVDAASSDGKLGVDEVWRYSASHQVTQPDIDAGGNITNTATADSAQTEPVTDDAFVPVEQKPAMQIQKSASVPGGSADTVGELITYTVTLTNTGNQTLTGITASDPSVSNLDLVPSDATADGELDVNESWTYIATRAVTQADIDAGGNILNTATGDSSQTPPVEGTASVPVAQRPAMDIAKQASVPGNSADTVGGIISYTILVRNTGNQTLTEVQVTDPFVSDLQLVIDDASSDGRLGVDEVWRYTASHKVTQQDIDDDGTIDNTATADSQQTEPVSASASVPVEQRPALVIAKDAAVPGGTADYAGEIISYTIAVTNTGTQTLTGVSVADPFVSDLQLLASDATADQELDVGETWLYSATHKVTQEEIDAGVDITNLATATSTQSAPAQDDAAVPVEQKPAMVLDKALASIGGDNDLADAVDDLLNYTVTVFNTGNQTLTGVTVADPRTGLVDGIPSLAPGAAYTWTTSYKLTQDDLDNYGGGDGVIDNTATARSEQTPLTTDSEMVPVFVRPSLSIDKVIAKIDGGNGNAFADAPDDLLHYTITVKNEGTVTLENVVTTDQPNGDPPTVLGVIPTLAPQQSFTYETVYKLKQSDIDDNGHGDGYIDNVAQATYTYREVTLAVDDAESVPVVRSIALGLDEQLATITGGNGNALADWAGDALNFRFVVTNAGNVTLNNVRVLDSLTKLDKTLTSIGPGQTIVLGPLDGATYTLKQSDLDGNGDSGSGRLGNVSTVTADETGALVVSDTEAVTLVYRPRIDLIKQVSVDGGSQWFDANTPLGAPTLLSGTNPLFKFIVKNVGNITLPGVQVTDSSFDLNGGDAGKAHDFGTLAPNDSEEWVFTGATYQSGLQADTATATVVGMPTVFDVDNAYYVGA